jgi:hypothetical protein
VVGARLAPSRFGTWQLAVAARADLLEAVVLVQEVFPHRSPLGGAKAQFGGDDDAGQNIGFAALADAPRDGTLPVPARQ